jgi:ComF family protein
MARSHIPARGEGAACPRELTGPIPRPAHRPPIHSLLRNFLDPFLEFLYPPLCLSCGGRLAAGESLLCAPCLHRAPLLHQADSALARARRELHQEYRVEDVAALWHFEGPVRDLVHSIKYGALWSAAEEAGTWLGRRMVRASDRWLPDLIVPVPLHPARVRERGYNQSACIARGVARVLGVPAGSDAAARTRDTATQTALDRGRRRENVAGAFRIRRPEPVRGARVLIVDDVVTTGATVGALAGALMEAGSAGCAVASLAIAMSDPP